MSEISTNQERTSSNSLESLNTAHSKASLIEQVSSEIANTVSYVEEIIDYAKLEHSNSLSDKIFSGYEENKSLTSNPNIDNSEKLALLLEFRDELIETLGKENIFNFIAQDTINITKRYFHYSPSIKNAIRYVFLNDTGNIEMNLGNGKYEIALTELGHVKYISNGDVRIHNKDFDVLEMVPFLHFIAPHIKEGNFINIAGEVGVFKGALIDSSGTIFAYNRQSPTNSEQFLKSKQTIDPAAIHQIQELKKHLQSQVESVKSMLQDLEIYYGDNLFSTLSSTGNSNDSLEKLLRTGESILDKAKENGLSSKEVFKLQRNINSIISLNLEINNIESRTFNLEFTPLFSSEDIKEVSLTRLHMNSDEIFQSGVGTVQPKYVIKETNSELTRVTYIGRERIINSIQRNSHGGDSTIIQINRRRASGPNEIRYSSDSESKIHVSNLSYYYRSNNVAIPDLFTFKAEKPSATNEDYFQLIDSFKFDFWENNNLVNQMKNHSPESVRIILESLPDWKEVEELAAEFKDRFNIKVELFPVDYLYGQDYKKFMSSINALQILPQMAKDASLYPEGLLNKLGLKEIVLLDYSIKDNEQFRGHYHPNTPIYHNTIFLSEADSTFHHELYHLIENHKFGGLHNNNLNWSKMVSQIDNSKNESSIEKPIGYANAYGRDKGIDEDQATMAASLMANPEDMFRRAKKDDVLKQKIEKIIIEYESFSNGLMDRQYFEDLANGEVIDENYWEKKNM